MKIRIKHLTMGHILLFLSSIVGSCISSFSIEGTPCPCPENGYECCDGICQRLGEGCDDTDTADPIDPFSSEDKDEDTSIEPDAGDTVDTGSDTGFSIPLAELGEPCTSTTLCNVENDLVCHAWRIPNDVAVMDDGSPYKCKKRCETSDECNEGYYCRTISYIEGENPPQGQILHTKACVSKDETFLGNKCFGVIRCPLFDFVPGKWTCFLDSVFVNAWAILDDCGLTCSAQKVKSCGTPDLCIQDAGVGSCFEKGKGAVVPSCREETCEEVCGTLENRGRFYCDGEIQHLCWAAQYENNVDQCPDMCFDQPFPKEVCGDSI